MFLDILYCRADGTQELVREEVPDDFLGPTPTQPEQTPVEHP